MTLQVVGAGLGRTGTMSLKLALEQLLGGRCYHMVETFSRPDDRLVFKRAFEGEAVDWADFYADYVATVDWPAAGLWRQISATFPDALVLLSVRDVDEWWQSASKTIFEAMSRENLTRADGRVGDDGLREAMMTAFTPDFTDERAAKAAYVAHNDDVRATVPPEKLLEYRTGDGWDPLCDALGVPVPDEPFPHTNTTADFRSMARLDES